MNLENKALPFVAGLAVAVVAGLLLLGRDLFEPARPADPATAPPATTAATLHPKQVEARQAIREGRLEDARKILAAIPEGDPAYPAALADRAVLLETTGEYETAMTVAASLLALAPENAVAHLTMARSLHGLGDDPRAEIACLRALEIDPANASARYTIGLIRLAQGRVDRAIDAYLRAMDRAPDRARIDEALADLTRLEQRRPDLAEVHYVLAFFANSLGARDQEKLELERYLATDPSGPVAEQARTRLAELG